MLTSALDPRFRQLTFSKLEDGDLEDLKEKIIEYTEEQQKLQKEDNDKGNDDGSLTKNIDALIFLNKHLSKLKITYYLIGWY